jgi:RsiW-degrading membrane proteinase PrsW (M82 family)
VLSITPAIVAELLLGVLALIGVGIYVAMHPEQLSIFQNLLRQLQNASDTEQMINLVSPWLSSPIVLLGALVFFAALSPIIEETAKSLTAWTLFDRLTSPAQGFAIGAISGAAFGLVESLLVSDSPGPGWSTRRQRTSPRSG